MIKLREYQEQALAAEARYRAEHPDETRLAIVLPTGTGKGTILAERAARFLRDPMQSSGRRVLVLVHTDELVQDLAARCRLAVKGEELPFAVGIVKAGQDDTDADIVVASVQTIANPERRARIHNVGLMIIDECHHGVATTYQAVMQHFGCLPDCDHPNIGRELNSFGGQCTDCFNTGYTGPPVPALGFTATLERADGQGLGAVWQNVVFTRDISWAVRKGYLVQPIGYRLEIDLDGSELAGAQHFTTGNATALDCQIADGIAPERIVEKWTQLAKDRQTIVFAPLVRSATHIAGEFARAGISVAVVYGEQSGAERRATIAAFKSGEIQVLVNAMVLTEGFDHPGVSCVIVARPTKSRSLFIQMAGRGLRRVPGVPVEDQDCILITLADGTSDICSVADLSDSPIDRRTDGPLTVMEDEYDIGGELDEQARHWAGRVDATMFDPLVVRSSKAWSKTRAGHWFLPLGTEREYVFLRTCDVYALTRPSGRGGPVRVQLLHSGLPDLELAMQLAEDEATERGGDLGALVADRSRAWRRARPADDSPMLAYAARLGLDDEARRIMSSQAVGKAGKISDLIRRVEASRAIDRAVARIDSREATA